MNTIVGLRLIEEGVSTIDRTPHPHPRKAASVEEALIEEIKTQTEAGSLLYRRFVPFVLIHEFEALLFSDCAIFGREIGRADLIGPLQDIRDQFPSPEQINDSPDTAPSKRIEKLMPEYQKPLHGNLAALGIGLPRIRSECHHFSQWIAKLEQIGERIVA